MRHLIHTLLAGKDESSLTKYEIYSTQRKLDHYEKVVEGSVKVVSYYYNGSAFEITNLNVDLSALYEANQPDPNKWYSDGPHRVNLEMLIHHLLGKN